MKLAASALNAAISAVFLLVAAPSACGERARLGLAMDVAPLPRETPAAHAPTAPSASDPSPATLLFGALFAAASAAAIASLVRLRKHRAREQQAIASLHAYEDRLATLLQSSRSMDALLSDREQAHLSERARMQAARQEAEEQFRKVFLNAPLHGFILRVVRDGQGRVTDTLIHDITPMSAKSTGRPRLELLGMRASDVFGTENVVPLMPLCQRVMDTGRSEQFEGRFPIDEHRYIGTAFVLGKDLYANLAVDVTEQRRTELERDRLYSAIEQAGEAVIITDKRGKIQYVNPAFVTLTGYSREDALGQNPKILKSGIQDDNYYRNLWETISSGRVWRGQFINRKKDGSLFTEQASISPVRDESGVTTSYVAVKRNISRELELEDQLQQARKMESVGRLAGGVAHDFKNMLSVIIGRADLALGRADLSPDLESTLEEIRKAALHSADITRQLLAFARKQTISPQVLSLNDAVERTLKMLRRLIGENIDLTWLPADGLWPVRIDPAQVDQMLANLAVNARDAITGIGKVTIATSNVSLDGSTLAMGEQVPAGQYVMLCVSDDGCGMTREVVERAFEPFFTTKTLGRGTGLGLATVYGIVKQNQGFADIHSDPGRGTAFEIFLPRAPGEVTRTQPPRAEELPEGSATVLLVEDEAMILDFASTALRALGYTVLSASTPGEALRMARDEADRIQLVITDVIMPEMSGHELADKLTKIIPGVKSIYMSGYTSDVLRDELLRDETRFLQKPFTVGDLAMKVSKVLGSTDLRTSD